VSTQDEALEQIAGVVREHYDLGEVSMPREVPSAHQRRHRKLLIDTTAGRFVIKTYKTDPVVLDSLSFQHRLSKHLQEHGLPVAAICPARSGRTVVEQPGWALELQQFVPGEQMVVTSDTLAQAATALGRFHEVCEHFPVPPRDARMWRFSEVPRTNLQGLFERARQETTDELVVDYCNEIALFLHAATEALALERRKDFETGLIHGDWHGGNLLFHEGKLAAILDLEFAGAGCYLEDIAYAISNLSVRTTINESKLYYRTNLLLDRYQSSRPLSYQERVALYYAVGVKHITTVAYQVPLYGGTIAGYSAAAWMERLALQCRWLAEQSRKARWGE